MSGVSDLEIYQRLTAIVEDLEDMFQRGPTLIGGTALNTACKSLRGMASAIYEHSLSQDDTEPNRQ
jgi:hypothetical protein